MAGRGSGLVEEERLVGRAVRRTPDCKIELEVAFYELVEGSLIAGAGTASDYFAVLVDEDGRDGLDAVLTGDVGGLINVVLGDDSAAGEGLCSSFKSRGEHAAWAAPGGPEVYECWKSRVKDFCLEVCVVDVLDGHLLCSEMEYQPVFEPAAFSAGAAWREGHWREAARGEWLRDQEADA